MGALSDKAAELVDVTGSTAGSPDAGSYMTTEQLNDLNAFARLVAGSTRTYTIAADTAPLTIRNHADEVVAGSGLATAIAAQTGGYGRIHLQGDFTGCTLTTATVAERLVVTGEPDGGTTITLADAATQWWQTSGTQEELTGSLGADATVGTQKITSSSWAALVSEGDRLMIASAASFNNKRSYYRKAERCVVRAVSGSEIILEAALSDTYATADTVSLYRYTSEPTVEFRDLHVYAGGGGIQKEAAIRLDYCDRPVFERLHVEGVAFKRGLRTWDCFAPHAERVTVKDIRNAYRDQAENLGYGIEWTGSVRGRIHNCRGERNRHSFEINGGHPSIDMPVSRWSTISSCEADHDLSTPYSSHGGSQYTEFLDNKAFGCGGFIIARGSHTTIRRFTGVGLHGNQDPAVADDPDIAGADPAYNYAIGIGELVQAGGTGDNYDGIAGTGLVVDDVTLDAGANPHRVVPSESGQTMRIIRAFEPLTGATIKGLHTRRFTGGIELLGNTNDRVTIRDSVLDCGDMFSTPRPIDVNPGGAAGAGSDGERTRDLLIDNVTFYEPTEDCIRVYGNSAATTATRTHNVRVVRSTYRRGTEAAEALVELGAGYFGKVIVEDNESDSTAAGLLVNSATNVSALRQRWNYCSDGYDTAP